MLNNVQIAAYLWFKHDNETAVLKLMGSVPSNIYHINLGSCGQSMG